MALIFRDIIKNIFVMSADTDVLVLLIYHLHKTWSNLQTLFITLGNQGSRKTFPLHIILKEMNVNLVDKLPAVHSLSGCDTTSKVCSKLACFTQPLSLE